MVTPGNGIGNNTNNVASQKEEEQEGITKVHLERLQSVLDRFEVTIAEANDLVALEDYRIVLICDDSGSMQRPAVPPHLRRLGEESTTRWQELQSTASLMVELGCCFDIAGVDVYFLNRPRVPRVQGANDSRFLDALKAVPTGKTPLTSTIGQVVAECQGERPVLLLILTDGVPDGGPRQFIELVRDVVHKRTSTTTFKFQVMACTPEEDEIAWLNKLDAELPQVDVTDDYCTERDQVLKAKHTSTFTRGDWVLKAMLGPISHKFDLWDERKNKSELQKLLSGASAYCNWLASCCTSTGACELPWSESIGTPNSKPKF
mmetsp:Transcript_63107/g.150447  ORF Transcript_63107/g.150447 Transcript_63107/m.150447 type:complete len:318 (+) Transcript_63107:89-1042(+)